MIALCLLLLGVNNDAIPESWWDVSAETSRYNTDAVILVDETEVSFDLIKRRRVVRILNEYGRAAAETSSTARLTQVRATVTDRSGEVTRMKRKEDLVKLTIARYRGDRAKATLVLPPGITNDCIVEMKWQIPVFGGSLTGWEDTYAMSEEWPVREKRWTIDGNARRQANLGLNMRRPPGEGQFESNTKGDGMEMVYRNLPPEGYHPYSDSIPDLFVVVYRQFPTTLLRPKTYYSDLGEQILRSGTKDKVGGDFKKWSKGLKAGMPQDPVEATKYLIAAMHKRIPNNGMMTSEERAQQDIKAKEKYGIGAAWKKGFASRYEHTMLFYQIAKAVDLPFNVVVPSDRRGHVFRPNVEEGARSIVGMDLSGWLFEIETPQGALYFDPAEWAIQQPYIPVRYQGQTAIRYDVEKKWKGEPFRLPVYRHDFHRRDHVYRTKIDDNGVVHYDMTQVNNGRFRGGIFRTYMPMTEAERQEALRDRYENRMGNITPTSYAVAFNQNSAEVKVTGSVEVGDVTQLVLVPFPSAFSPLGNPLRWSKDRKKPIMTNPFFQLDSNEMVVGKDWRVVGNVSWDRKNNLGRVAFVVNQQDGKITIQRLMELAAPMMRPEASEELKQLLAWMDEAEDQRVLLERTSGNRQTSAGGN